MKDIHCTLPILEAMGAALNEGMDPAEVHAALCMATAMLFKRFEPNFGAAGAVEPMVRTNSEVMRAMIKTVQGDGDLIENLQKHMAT